MRSLNSILAFLLASHALAVPAGAQRQDLRSPDARDAAQPALDLHRRQDVFDRPEVRVVRVTPEPDTPWLLVGGPRLHAARRRGSAPARACGLSSACG